MLRNPFVLLVLLLLSTLSLAQTTPLSYTIAPWLGNKKAAASITFDDAVNGQFTYALPLLNQYGFTGTFFLTTNFISEQLGSWQLIREAARAGHEIANHTTGHLLLTKLPDDSLTAQLVDANRLIDAQIPAAKTLTHAYPNGVGRPGDTGRTPGTNIRTKAVYRCPRHPQPARSLQPVRLCHVGG